MFFEAIGFFAPRAGGSVEIAAVPIDLFGSCVLCGVPNAHNFPHRAHRSNREETVHVDVELSSVCVYLFVHVSAQPRQQALIFASACARCVASEPQVMARGGYLKITLMCNACAVCAGIKTTFMHENMVNTCAPARKM